MNFAHSISPVARVNSLKLCIFVACTMLFAAIGCKEPLPESVPLPTKIKLKVQHHHQPIPFTKVYIKYNAIEFPGYDAPPSWYDKMLTADAAAQVVFEPVPEGRHLIVGIGYDSLYFPNDVIGSLWTDIAVPQRAVLDTILYVSEEH